MARDLYVSMEELLVVPLPRAEKFKVLIGHKPDGRIYVDARTWYEDENGKLQPGKGTGMPDGPVWDAIARAILERGQGGPTQVFSIKDNKYIEEVK